MTIPRTCRSHCAKCNICFAGDTAFDSHITHEGDITIHLEPPDVLYDKGDRAGERKLEMISGTCDRQDGCWNNGRKIKVMPASIWRMALTEDQKARLDMLSEQKV